MQVTINDDIALRLPANTADAAALVNEILEQALLSVDEPPEHRLENRPDWQEKIKRSRQQWAEGDVVSHDEVMAWKHRQK
jgi:predicted transcriptional regulator